MQHAIATVSLSGTLREELDAVAGAGGVGIFENRLPAREEDAGAVRPMSADLGLDVVAFQPYGLADPSGLIQSQVAESRDRRVRTALNASQPHATTAKRFVTRCDGGGVRQVERRGYRDFGVVNAPIRLAAQTRMARQARPRSSERRQ